MALMHAWTSTRLKNQMPAQLQETSDARWRRRKGAVEGAQKATESTRLIPKHEPQTPAPDSAYVLKTNTMAPFLRQGLVFCGLRHFRRCADAHPGVTSCA